MKPAILFTGVLVFFLSCGTNSNIESAFSPENYDVYIDEEYRGIHIDDFYVHNNVWGKNNIGRYEQGVFRSGTGEEEVFGWRWRWPRTDGYTVRAYPEIIYGTNPWLQRDNEFLPCAVTSRNIHISYSAELVSKGEHNLAFDIWVTNSSASSTETITHEIMIWMANYGMTPGGRKKGSATIDGISYSVYVWEHVTLGQPTGDRTYIAFISDRDNYLSASVQIDEFFHYLVNSSKELLTGNYITESSYIASVELGTEIVDGRGEIRFSSFEVDIE